MRYTYTDGNRKNFLCIFDYILLHYLIIIIVWKYTCVCTLVAKLIDFSDIFFHSSGPEPARVPIKKPIILYIYMPLFVLCLCKAFHITVQHIEAVSSVCIFLVPNLLIS